MHHVTDDYIIANYIHRYAYIIHISMLTFIQVYTYIHMHAYTYVYTYLYSYIIIRYIH